MIGGLSLANTVAAAVFERIRDFGIKRALGATDLQLLREVLGEALGGVRLTGGVLGVGLALACGTRWTRALRATASSSSSSRRACLVFALAFSVLLGARPPATPPSDRAAVARRGDPAGA